MLGEHVMQIIHGIKLERHGYATSSEGGQGGYCQRSMIANAETRNNNDPS